jgi:hypothetical protein
MTGGGCNLQVWTMRGKCEPINKFSRDELLEPSFYLTVDNFTILEDGNERTIESPVKSKIYEIPTPD